MITPEYSGKPLLDKLGIQAGNRVVLRGVAHDDQLRRLLEERGAVIALRAPRGGVEAVVFRADAASKLIEEFRRAARDVSPAGMIWVFWPKNGTLKRDYIREIGLTAGLVDVKICAVDEQISGLKFMIPRSKRSPKR